MPTRAEIDLRERAERALRGGHAREALGFYAVLLANAKAEAAHYEAWLEGAASAYLALGRNLEGGYALLGLRRYAEAQRLFSPGERPLEWALCAGRLGLHGDAARVLAEHGHPALAALELDSVGARAGARAEWERVLRDPRLEGRRYETALAHFNLAECLQALGDQPGAARAFAAAERLLEGLADEFETRGERERAFDCWSVLLRLGKNTGSFENVAEGYLNSIRIAAAGDQSFYVLHYYDDFLAYAVEREEWHAAATIAREAADHSTKSGLPYDRHYLTRSAELWQTCARHNQAAGGPIELTASALHAAVDAATSLADFALAGRLYAGLAALPLSEKQRRRYASLARRYESMPIEARPPAPTFPDYLRRANAYQDVWRQDLVEWELGGDPTAVLSRFVVERPPNTYARFALRALLLSASPTYAVDNVPAVAELAIALGRVQFYEMLAPLERLYRHPAAEARAAVMRGVSQIYSRRSFNLIRQGLTDPASSVAEQALRALRELRFLDGLEPLTRIFRESTDDRVRVAALDSIAGVRSTAAALVLLEAARQETGALRDIAVARLAEIGGEEVTALVRQARDAEVDERRETLDRILKMI
jgi:hypothetical protein